MRVFARGVTSALAEASCALPCTLCVGQCFLWEACDWCVARLQNFFTHIRKLPHFDTRFGAVLPRWSPPQKAVFSVYAGRSVVAFLLSWHMCLKGQFLGSKRVSKWGNFLISLNFFFVSPAPVSKIHKNALPGSSQAAHLVLFRLPV